MVLQQRQDHLSIGEFPSTALHTPDAPTAAERTLYVETRRWALLPFYILAIAGVEVALARLIMYDHFFLLYLPIVVLLFVSALLFVLSNVTFKKFDLAAHDDLVGQFHPASYPSVDVFLPVCGESLIVLRNHMTT